MLINEFWAYKQNFDLHIGVLLIVNDKLNTLIFEHLFINHLVGFRKTRFGI